jgi:hypothetical protein
VQADYLDAFQRHWDDAERLFNAARWANADQLHGLAAECGLKRLMIAFGMQVNLTNGAPSLPVDRVHANKIWSRFESYRSGRETTEYVLAVPNPFSDWDISDRYAHHTQFDQPRCLTRQAGAQAVRDLITKARTEGMI